MRIGLVDVDGHHFPNSKWEWDVKYDVKRKGYSVAYKPVGLSKEWYFTQSFPVFDSEKEAYADLKQLARKRGFEECNMRGLFDE